MKNNKTSLFLRGLIAENPVLVLILGTCPTIAKSDTVFNALGLGVCTLLVLVLSNIMISALRKLIPDTVRIPCYILVVAGFVTITQMTVHAISIDLYNSLGSFIALIVVNCIILGRAEAFASKNTVGASFLDGLFQGIGYTVALVIMCVIRELLGSGTFGGGLLNGGNGIRIIPEGYPAMMLIMPVGGFLTLGFVIAGFQWFNTWLERKRKAGAK